MCNIEPLLGVERKGDIPQKENHYIDQGDEAALHGRMPGSRVKSCTFAMSRGGVSRFKFLGNDHLA